MMARTASVRRGGDAGAAPASGGGVPVGVEPSVDAPVDGPRRPGRPRDPQARRAILEATMAEIEAAGFGGLTIDSVAARAGVSKATIYRRWPGKEALVLDAAATLVPLPDVPDTGSVRGDLVELFGRAYSSGKQHYHSQMASLIAEAGVNPDVRELLGEYSRRRRSTLLTIVDRGIDRHELPLETDPDLLLELISGGLLYRSRVSALEVDQALIERVVDIVLRGFGSPSAPPKKPRRTSTHRS